MFLFLLVLFCSLALSQTIIIIINWLIPEGGSLKLFQTSTFRNKSVWNSTKQKGKNIINTKWKKKGTTKKESKTNEQTTRQTHKHSLKIQTIHYFKSQTFFISSKPDYWTHLLKHWSLSWELVMFVWEHRLHTPRESTCLGTSWRQLSKNIGHVRTQYGLHMIKAYSHTQESLSMSLVAATNLFAVLSSHAIRPSGRSRYTRWQLCPCCLAWELSTSEGLGNGPCSTRR